ncbi:MAG TPA: TIGR01777 family oxidoreductase [Verrucomicrobiota bacterium]|nr:TIGR01777 family oxidoreductase [Verrucomicrobiota bacterium]HNU50481.1 TIGR01777 family oxidoreductase [Verrucomicrobiota bacterium]
MNILITGATGLIGRALAARLEGRRHRVVPLRRAPAPRSGEPTWDPERGRVDLEPAGPLDAVIHLAGETIAQRWTPSAKSRIGSSRIDATRRLSEALAALACPPRVLVAASATGFYGDRGDEVLDEQSAPGRGFLPELCQAWESATAPARDRGIRVVCLRLGIVLARDGGALARMLPVFRWGLGGRIGSGRQYWSWITLEDLLGAIERCLEESQFSGAVNAVAPGTATNALFTAALSRALRRPALLPVPAFALRIALGEMGREVLLASARVRPTRLLEAGFAFLDPDLDSAFRHVV